MGLHDITTGLKDLFTDTVTYRAFSSRDVFGAPTYGSGTEYAARVVREHHLVRDGQGDEVVSTAQVWIKGTPEVDPEDQVELSDGTTPEILTSERFQDERGASHTKVYFR